MKKVLKWIVVVLFGLYVVSQVMEFIDEQLREAEQKEKVSNFDPTKSISYKVVQNAMKAASNETEYTIVDEELEADDDTTPAPKFQG